MNIIFGKEQATDLEDKYTLLELDTFQIAETGSIVTAYCAVENLPFSELSEIDSYKNQHVELLQNYRTRNWEQCCKFIEQLKGKWGGQLDTFYEHLNSRVNQYIETDPGPDWTSVLQK